MNIVRSTARCSAAVGSKRVKNADFGLAFSASKIRTTQGDIANSVRQRRCGNCSTERSWSRTGNVQSATSRLPITARSSPTISNPKAWEEVVEMTTLKTSRQRTADAIHKKGRRGCVRVIWPNGYEKVGRWERQRPRSYAGV